MKNARIILAFACVVFTACTSKSARSTDAGARADAGSSSDAGARDFGMRMDLGENVDLGELIDLGAPFDSTTPSDSSAPSDAMLSSDAAAECESATNCSECTIRANCGFCPGMGCFYGSASGPIREGVEESCDGWAWFPSSCMDSDAGSSTCGAVSSSTCDFCTMQPYCGYCPSLGCVTGTFSGPRYEDGGVGTCEGWAYLSSSCE